MIWLSEELRDNVDGVNMIDAMWKTTKYILV